MTTPSNYSANLSLPDKILYVLSLLKKATTDEIAMEIMELEGVSSEEGVAELTIEIHERLQKLHEEGLVTFVTEHDKKVKYFLKQS
jgi:hypothetical protein